MDKVNSQKIFFDITKFINTDAILSEEIQTYPSEIIEYISSNEKLIYSYEKEAEIRFSKYEKIKAPSFNDKLRMETNQHDNAFKDLCNKVYDMLSASGKDLFLFHLTRLMDYEIEDIYKNGLQISSYDLFYKRIANLCEKDYITKDEADYLRKLRPYDDGRANQLWFLSSYKRIREKTFVQDLYHNWGGEAVYNRIEHTDVGKKLRNISSPCVVSCRMPISEIKKWVLENFAKDLVYYVIGIGDVVNINSYFSYDIQNIYSIEKLDAE